jgi:hypothetical protein
MPIDGVGLPLLNSSEPPPLRHLAAYIIAQEPLSAYFQALQEASSKDYRALRIRSLQLCLQLLSEEHPQAHAIVALLRDHLVEVRPEEAKETVQVVLDVFSAGLVPALQLLPPLLALAALPAEGIYVMVMCPARLNQGAVAVPLWTSSAV